MTEQKLIEINRISALISKLEGLLQELEQYDATKQYSRYYRENTGLDGYELSIGFIRKNIPTSYYDSYKWQVNGHRHNSPEENNLYNELVYIIREKIESRLEEFKTKFKTL